jgi:hypothetical protein
VKSLAVYEDVFNHESNELNEWEAIGIEDGSAAATACHLKGLIQYYSCNSCDSWFNCLLLAVTRTRRPTS